MADPLTSPRPHNAVSEGNSSYFAPKNPVELAEPKDDMISYEELAKHDGEAVASVVSSAIADCPRRYGRGPADLGFDQGHCFRCVEELSIQERGQLSWYVAHSRRWCGGILTVVVFAGKDPSRALAQSSLKTEDCVPQWYDLEDKHKTVLSEWYTFFSKRYSIVGKVSPSDSAGSKL